jgi:hypothetical protein
METTTPTTLEATVYVTTILPSAAYSREAAEKMAAAVPGSELLVDEDGDYVVRTPVAS